MNSICHWAILFILITCTVFNSPASVAENVFNAKTPQILSSNDKEKLSQHRHDNLTELIGLQGRLTEDGSRVNIFENSAHQSHYPVKKQSKYKRLRYLGSYQSNRTKSMNDTTSKDRRPRGGIVFSDTNQWKNATADDSNLENSISRLELSPVQPTRKKRRRIVTSITAVKPLSAASLNVSSNSLSQYLNFGRKIPQHEVLLPIVSMSEMSDHRSENLMKMMSATKLPLLPTNVTRITNWPTIRPTSIKNLKPEIIQNNTLCRWNMTDEAIEHTNSHNFKRCPKSGDKSDKEHTVQVDIRKNIKILQMSIASATSQPTLNQSSTKMFSTAVITSVSVKSDGYKRMLVTTVVPSLNSTISLLKPFLQSNLLNATTNPSLSTLSTSRTSVVPYFQQNISINANTNKHVDLPKVYQPIYKLSHNTTPIVVELTDSSNIKLVEQRSKIPLPSPVFHKKTETLVLDLTTWRTTTTFQGEPSSSNLFPFFIPYNDVKNDLENFKYHVGNSSLKSKAGGNKTDFAIFSKNVEKNFSVGAEQFLKPLAGLQNMPENSKNFNDTTTLDHFYLVTYILAGFGIVPLVIGITLAIRMILYQNKNQIFEGSEYFSEYNQSPLEFKGVTSSPIATKLPRIHQQANWEIGEKTRTSINGPINNEWEFPRNKLRLQTILGQGNFGQVWKAEADDISSKDSTRIVAVKMVKEISSMREKEDLIKELLIMQHLGSHPNVVTLLGCCTEKEPFMLIMEYVMYGKLLSFLRDHRTRTHRFNFNENKEILTSRDLTVFAYYIAHGMEYLQRKQVIHRDLAARNILIDHNKLCKIADFGMSRCVDKTGQMYEHRQSKGALPIRWMAPESLHYSCYTYKTDVWSFGILMWEIVTLGSMPYASMGARVVMRKVEDGYRLEKPKQCKIPLYSVISKCWHSDPNKRPCFTELKQDLLKLLEDPELQGNCVDLACLVEDINQIVHSSHNEKFII